MPDDVAGREVRHPVPSVFATAQTQDLTGLELLTSDFSLSKHTLGWLGIATEVKGGVDTGGVILRQPFDPALLTGLDARTVRVFRVELETCSFRPVWDSGINVALGFAWSRIRRPGVYAPLGLPRDRLLSEILRALARARSYRDPQTWEESQTLAKQILSPILETEDADINKIRELLTHLEIETSPGAFLPGEIRLGRDAVPLPFPLPGGISVRALKHWLEEWLNTPNTGLPEEVLFSPPERPDDVEPPWLILPERPLPRPLPQPVQGEPLPTPWPPKETSLPDDRLQLAERWLGLFEPLLDVPDARIFGWLFPRDWWMHHRDAEHTGEVRHSAICRTTVQSLVQRRRICLDGPILSIPCVVAGKVYVGTGTRPCATGGTLYKIDLATGCIDASFSFSGEGDRRAIAGVASSPAVKEGKVYFSALTGKVYCLDAATLACLWVTDLRHADGCKDQPVEHGRALANGWSSPVVANNRVYVACGEGESNTFGFVYCLEACSGKVIWLFCTNQFNPLVANKPNVLPPLAYDPRNPLPKKFTIAARNPAQQGASPWSAPAYCPVLNRLYIGTGNSQNPELLPQDDPLPDPDYASGLLSLDATTGELRGFFQPDPSDSYRPEEDLDVDVPAGPMLFTRDGKRYVCFGSKNGTLFVLDAINLTKVVARRQLLPYQAGVPKKPFDTVDPPPGKSLRENKSGIFGTAALASHLECIFVGLGGYDGAIDSTTTPFIRAVDWEKLQDAWPTTGTNPPKYSNAEPPVYRTAGEAGLSSPAVVNDVVFVSTTKPALYAFNAVTGQCLWVAPGITAIPGSYALGPAIYGNYVVNGLSTGHLYIYSL